MKYGEHYKEEEMFPRMQLTVAEFKYILGYFFWRNLNMLWNTSSSIWVNHFDNAKKEIEIKADEHKKRLILKTPNDKIVKSR